LSKATFSRFREKATELFGGGASDEEVLQVMAAWHGTPCLENVDSIIENGILAPYDFTNKGEMIRVSHGSVFGQGIYVSERLSHSNMYTVHNKVGVNQCFYSLILPGKATVVTQQDKKVSIFLFS
jgi:hypothetical protein